MFEGQDSTYLLKSAITIYLKSTWHVLLISPTLITHALGDNRKKNTPTTLASPSKNSREKEEVEKKKDNFKAICVNTQTQ